MTPQILLTDHPTPPDHLVSLLHARLPGSLPVLRRLQCARNLPGAATPHTHILHARYHHHDHSGGRDGDGDGDFAAAYVDLSRAPETQVWVYATVEDGLTVVGGDGGVCGARTGRGEGGGGGGGGVADIDLVLAVLRRVRALAGSGGGGGVEVLVGSLHEGVRQALLARGVGMRIPPGAPDGVDWEFCGKWLFRAEELPLPGPCRGRGAAEVPLPREGMRWDRVRKGDVGLVLSRTSIARQEATLLMLPSAAVRLADGTPVAWAFMALDGSLMTLHVEEPYRRLGLAKAVACKLMRDHLGDYGDDGWGAADVFYLNHKSQAVCQSIGGRLGWTVSWALIDLSSVGDPL